VIEKMRNRVGDKLVNIAVVYPQDPIIGNRLVERVKESFNCNDLIFSELSTGITANLGPGTVGIIAYPALEG
jgi:fatty acid-binding protein DegV